MWGEKKKVARARLLTTILSVVVDHGETAGTTQQAPWKQGARMLVKLPCNVALVRLQAASTIHVMSGTTLEQVPAAKKYVCVVAE